LESVGLLNLVVVDAIYKHRESWKAGPLPVGRLPSPTSLHPVLAAVAASIFSESGEGTFFFFEKRPEKEMGTTLLSKCQTDKKTEYWAFLGQ